MSSPVQQDAYSSLRRGLSLLDAFSAQHREMTIRELSARSGVARSTTHRLARELVSWGALEKTPRGLRLGVKLFEIGTLAPGHGELRDAAAPLLHSLHQSTSLTANLAVREGDHIVYLEKINGPRLRVPHTRLGGRGTLHATALGKAILAFSLDRDSVELTTLRALTPRTIVDNGTLRRELARVRARRIAYDVEESRPGLFCVASPVLDRSDRAIAAISLTGATALSQAERHAHLVASAAVALSRRLMASCR